MASIRLQRFFEKVWERLGETDKKRAAIFVTKEAASVVPIVGPIIKDVIEEFEPNETKDLIIELKESSKLQLEEINENFEATIQYLEFLRQYALDIPELKESLRLLRPHLPTIEDVLRKGIVSEGQFFRREPQWSDFQGGFIVERDEVNIVLQKLENENIQLVIGPPASGKSIVLKYIGFKLAEKGFTVYYIDSKHISTSPIELYFGWAANIDDKYTVIIVDDVHLCVRQCRQLVESFKNRSLNTGLIVGARETQRVKEGSSRENSLLEEFDERTELEASDIAEELIAHFLKRAYDITDENKITSASSEVDIYKADLWNLSYALKSYDIIAETVSIEDIYQQINNRITEIDIGEDTSINAADILLPLCSFFRFEFPLERKFLTKTLALEETTIDKLVSLSEINKIEELGVRSKLALEHSSLASLYFDTYRSHYFPDLGDKVKDRIYEKTKIYDWEEGLFELYFISTFTRNFELIECLAEYWEDDEHLKGLFEKLLKKETIQDSIKVNIERSDEQDILNRTISFLQMMSSWLDIDLGLELARTWLAPKLENKDLNYVVSFVVDLIEDRFPKLLLPFIDIILIKMKTTQDIETVGGLISEMTDPSEFPDSESFTDVGIEIAPKVIDRIASIIEEENDLMEITAIIEQTDESIGMTTAAGVASHINKKILASKIEQECEIDIAKAKDCLDIIAGLRELEEDVASDILRHVKPSLRTALTS